MRRYHVQSLKEDLPPERWYEADGVAPGSMKDVGNDENPANSRCPVHIAIHNGTTDVCLCPLSFCLSVIRLSFSVHSPSVCLSILSLFSVLFLSFVRIFPPGTLCRQAVGELPWMQ
jgi:hypothetical protein